jgi:putative hydrolase of HD superfamily
MRDERAAGNRLEQQIAFVLELDKLKSVYRVTELLQEDRRENAAEHSWHVALLALVLRDYCRETVDFERVLALLLLHDSVEIYAGDTYVYDPQAVAQQQARESAAADRLFALLPADQTAYCAQLFEEFNNGRTPEARYAQAVDRLLPVLQNFFSGGKTWKKNHVRAEQVRARLQPIRPIAEELWRYAERLVDEALARGYLRD